MNNNGSKPTYIDPKQPGTVVALDEGPDEELMAQALDSIRGAERLSGFGRFATKMQNLFQTSGTSHGKRESSHLKAAPIMMSVGLLLLLATGLLFLLSKPEGAVHTRFRQPVGLASADDHKRAPAPNVDAGVTENQLVGGESKPIEQAKSAIAAGGARQDASASRFSFADQGTDVRSAPNQAITNELQTPATVFVANPALNPVITPANSQGSRASETQLPAGTELVAHTTNAISSGLESPVIAVVDRNVQLGDGVLIPQGTRVIGYTAGAVKDRINVRFTSLLLPNNREVSISGLALMKDGSAGLVGKVRGSGHSVLAGAARVATGASALAIQFAGRNSLDQPFSQGDYLRNQLAAEVASEGSRYSNRLRQPVGVPIVTVKTNQSIRIFLLNALTISGGTIRDSKRPQQAESAIARTTEQNLPAEQALAAAQTAYIQALEARLAEMRAALDGRKANGGR